MISIQNTLNLSTGEASVLVNWYANAAIMGFGDSAEFDESQNLGFLLLKANELGRESSGLSCYALLWLAQQSEVDEQARYACAFWILNAARHSENEEEHESSLRRAITLIPKVRNLVFFSHCPSGPESDFIKARHKRICVVFNKKTVQKSPFITQDAALEECRTQSQKNAFLNLIEIHRARKVRIPRIKIRPHSLLVGMSGSGKTWVANQFARWRAIPLFATTVGQWHLRGGTNGITPTLDRIEVALRAGQLVIVIDEVEKFRLTSNDNANYFRCVLDEVMGMIEGAAGLSDEANANLKHSTILAAGAFQDLYRKKLGDISFSEEIDNMAPLTFDDIIASGWLPDELINRLGTVIEIRPPTATELSREMAALERATGVKRPKAWSPDGLATSMLGMRGLETYALELAKLKLRAGGGI